jgi:xanthine dehydrogenase small subunit
MQIATIEGLSDDGKLSPVQRAVVDNHGAQCGFCTPGVVSAMTGYVEKCVAENKKPCANGVKNHLTGNLCRCTGYEAILNSAENIEVNEYTPLQKKYCSEERIQELETARGSSLNLKTERSQIFLPVTVKEALEFKKQNLKTRIIAGATDLGVLFNKRGLSLDTVMSLQQVSDLQKTSKINTKINTENRNEYFVSAQTSLTEFETFIEKGIPELNHLLHRFASPQIKNQGTVVGNLVNASPIADLIPFFLVADAKVVMASVNGQREVELSKFYLGYKKIDLAEDELVLGIKFQFDSAKTRLKLYKVSQRRDLDISCITFAGMIQLQGKKISEINLAMGGVAATVQRLGAVEKTLKGQTFESAIFKKAAEQVMNEINPLSDIRGSKEYRKMLGRNLMMKFYDEISAGISSEVSP